MGLKGRGVWASRGEGERGRLCTDLYLGVPGLLGVGQLVDLILCAVEVQGELGTGEPHNQIRSENQDGANTFW